MYLFLVNFGLYVGLHEEQIQELALSGFFMT
jgi:hypothetical protein